VSSISPLIGFVGLCPLGRFGDPIKDVGPLALFLGSSDSDFITGMTFMLDGGLFMYP
jgi:NAD(P)-dependent dehydrogenase (short-subunit alcohol dehydrogenase family)